MNLVSEIRHSLSPVVDLVYPPRCPSCGVAVQAHGGLCVDCFSQIEVPLSDEGIIAASTYNDISRQLVLRFKHGRKLGLAPLLAGMMASHLPDAVQGAEPLLIPVPLHWSRLWQRGFNQAALLARELAQRGKGELCVDGLVRRKRTPSLGGLGRETRAKVLQNAISARASKADRIAGRSVILVDDVYTSGSTARACIKALESAGAANVSVACFARVAHTPLA